MPSLQELLQRSVTQSLGISDLLKKRDDEARATAETQMKIADLDAQATMQQRQNRAGFFGGVGALVGGAIGSAVGGPTMGAIGSRIGGAVGRGNDGLRELPQVAADSFMTIANQQNTQNEAARKSYTDLAEKGYGPSGEGQASEFNLPINGKQVGFKKLLTAKTKEPDYKDMESSYNQIVGRYETSQAIPKEISDSYAQQYSKIPGFVQLPKMGLKTKQANETLDNSFKVASALTKGVEDLKSDKDYQTARQQLASVSEMENLLGTDNPLVTKTFPLTIRKIAGDTGNQGEREQAAVAIFGGLTDQAKQFFQNLDDGRIAKNQLGYLKQYTQFYRELATNKVNSMINAKGDSMRAAYGDLVDPEKINRTFKPLYVAKQMSGKEGAQPNYQVGGIYLITDKSGRKVKAKWNGKGFEPQ